MIKVCSLDFLKKDFFETDVKTADGKVLFHSGEEITPSILLRLYFLNIYVEEPLEEKISCESVSEIETAKATKELSVLMVSETTEEKEETAKEAETTLAKDEKAEIVNVVPETIQESEVTANEAEIVQEKTIEPSSKSIDEIEQKTMASDKEKGPKIVEISSPEPTVSDETKGPRMATEDDITHKKETEAEKKIYGISEAKPEVVEEKPINPDDVPLVFDETTAKRIVQYSTKLAGILNYSAKEIKEIEKVAYYCNYGISQFKQGDLKNRNFRKLKAYAGYELLKDSEIVPIEIADAVKYSANNYESESFPLSGKIPYNHIVAITSFYEELLERNVSKEDALLKMLQLGGNHFNVFVLHKFIKMMRDTNG